MMRPENIKTLNRPEPRNDVLHVKTKSASLSTLPGGNGVMDSTLACCAGGPGSIPAIGIVELQYSSDFFSLSV